MWSNYLQNSAVGPQHILRAHINLGPWHFTDHPEMRTDGKILRLRKFSTMPLHIFTGLVLLGNLQDPDGGVKWQQCYWFSVYLATSTDRCGHFSMAGAWVLVPSEARWDARRKPLCAAHVLPTFRAAAVLCCLWICLCLEGGKYFSSHSKPRRAKPPWNHSQLLLATDINISHREIRIKIMIIILPSLCKVPQSFLRTSELFTKPSFGLKSAANLAYYLCCGKTAQNRLKSSF